MDSSCRIQLRVRYGEADRMGIAYYAHYFDWFTEGRTELLRQIGGNYREMEDLGLLLPVVRTAARYHRPCRYDDLVELDTSARVSPTRLRFDYRLGMEGGLLAEGFTEHAFVHKGDLRPLNARRAFPEIYAYLADLPRYSGVNSCPSC